MFEDDRTRRRDQETAEAFAAPRPGDRFQEMFSWWMVVVSVCPEGVKVMAGSGPTNLVRGRFPDGQVVEPFPERAEVHWYATAEDFRAAHRCDSIPGYAMQLADRRIDVTGWLDRAKSVPAAPTHPKPPATEPEAFPACAGEGKIPPEVADRALRALDALAGERVGALWNLRPYLARIAGKQP
jgi:hypothetical protein